MTGSLYPDDYVHAQPTRQRHHSRAEHQAGMDKRALASPALCLPGEDDPQTEHVFCVIHEYGDRVLRVIYIKTKEPPHIVTAYFDRGMKGKL